VRPHESMAQGSSYYLCSLEDRDAAHLMLVLVENLLYQIHFKGSDVSVPSESFPNLEASRRPIRVDLHSYRYAGPKDPRVTRHPDQIECVDVASFSNSPPKCLHFPGQVGLLGIILVPYRDQCETNRLTRIGGSE
jgi:hypothetical protein